MTDSASLEKKPFRIGLLLLPDSNLMSLAAALDPFRAANRRAGKALYDWQVLSPQGGDVTLTTGITLQSDPLPLHADMDLLILVAGFRLDAHATPALRAWLRQLRARGITYCGVDGGPWVLARAGLLNGRHATTHWEDLEAFAAAFPDLNALLYDPEDRPSPQRLVSQARLASLAPPVARAIALMEAEMEEPPSVAAIARAQGLSARRLEMLFRQHLDTAPGTFFLRLRLSEARRLALDTGLSVQEIALRTGFSGPSTLARAFRRSHGQSISALRAERQ